MAKDKVYSFRVDDLTEREIEFIAKERGISPGILIRDLLHKQIGELLDETKALADRSVDELIDDAQALLEIAKEKIRRQDAS